MHRVLAVLRSLLFPAIVGIVVFTSAGTWNLPFAWAVLAVFGLFAMGLALAADPDLLQERRSPGEGNRDRLTQGVSLLLMAAHWVLAGLDVGRFHWSPVGPTIQAAGVTGYVLALVALSYAMRVNRFYSSAVRIQTDRGHEVITTGPYRIVRHPGYAASLLAFLCGGVALGSWIGMLPIAVCIGLFIRRLLIEDAMLMADLPGYPEYASRVRYRLFPGVF